MRTLSTLSLCALPLLLAGCFDIPMTKGTDTSGDTAGGDTASDDTASDDTSGEDTNSDDTAADVGTANIRFVNLEGGAAITIQASTATGSISSDALYQTQGTAYQEIPAGAADLVATNSDGPVAELSATLAADGHYSVAMTPAGELLVSEDDLSDDDGTDSRLNLINVSGESVRWAVGYWNGDGWTGPGYQTLEDGQTATDTYAYATASVQLELYFTGLDGLIVDWNAAAFTQVEPGTMKNLYFWNEGDCSFLSSACNPMIIGQFEDGSTASVELISDFGWAG